MVQKAAPGIELNQEIDVASGAGPAFGLASALSSSITLHFAFKSIYILSAYRVECGFARVF